MLLPPRGNGIDPRAGDAQRVGHFLSGQARAGSLHRRLPVSPSSRHVRAGTFDPLGRILGFIESIHAHNVSG